jgi:triacylglycerol esterase/lipase EstA (alpha/beta hydrolase family)
MKQGYTVIVAPIAPISSNWERACELYAQLTAGRYVSSHSNKVSHYLIWLFASFDRFDPDKNATPNTYDVEVDYGTLPIADAARQPKSKPARRRRAILFTESEKFTRLDWKWGDLRKVHFLCHSQGGNTVRYLISLMKRGAPAEHTHYFRDRDRDRWVISVTTLGTPYKGTTIIDVLKNFASVRNYSPCNTRIFHY